MAGNRNTALRRQTAGPAYQTGASNRQSGAHRAGAAAGQQRRPARQIPRSQTVRSGARVPAAQGRVSGARAAAAGRAGTSVRPDRPTGTRSPAAAAGRAPTSPVRPSGIRPSGGRTSGTAARTQGARASVRTGGSAARPYRAAASPGGTPAGTVSRGGGGGHSGYQESAQTQVQGKKKKPRRFYDYSLLFCIIFLTVFGLIMIYSASSYTAQVTRKDGNSAFFMQRQAAIAAFGGIGMLIVSKINYHWFARFAGFAFGVSHILMVAVLFVGNEVNGKKRWLGVGSISFQPTELVKISLILMLAVAINECGNRINQWKIARKMVLMTIPIAGLVAYNNLSSGIIICGIAFVMLFVACKIRWPFFALCGAGMGTLIFAGPIGKLLLQLHILQAYQYRRIEAWLNPELDPTDKGFQILQGLYAIGSGGLVGQGLGESIQKLGFLPESQNDMIFAIICEELGLFGAVSIIMIFLFMIYRFMVIANNAPDLLGALIVVGVMGHIAIQVILNIAVVTNTIPNTGITLPFISYGGTSVLFLLIEMGLVLSVSNQIRLES